MATFRFPNETDEYRRARDALLDEEVRLRDATEAVAAQRRRLPLGGRLKADYRFERLDRTGAVHTVPFAELFGHHATLLLYSMMFGPDWDAPCPSCTCIVDGLDVSHRAVRETAALAVVAAATPAQLRHWAERRGWTLDLVSGQGNDYLLDYAGFDAADPSLVSVMNVFHRTADGIFHFWASELLGRPMANGHPRHVDMIWPFWNLLDMTPEGRGEALVPKQDYTHRYFSKHVLGESSGEPQP